MSTSRDYNDDVKYAVKFARKILGFVGGWPIPVTSPVSAKLKLRVRNFVTYFLFFLMIVPGLLRAFLKEKSGKAKLKIAGPVLNCSMQFFKFSILLYRSEEIRKSMDVIRQDWTNAGEQDREILRSKARIGRRVVLMSAITMYGGGLCYRTILPLSKGSIVTPDNVTIRPLACPAYFIFFNEQATPIYEILFVLQFFAGLATYSVISGSCGICALLVLHVCSQLRILVNKIKELAEGQDLDDEVVQQRIVNIVEYQTNIKRFLKQVETITEYICLVETVGGTFLTCIVGYFIIMEWENANAAGIAVFITLQFSAIFCVFIFCYIGQLLDDESNNVGLATITVDWYRLPIKKARCLIIVIAMSNYPMKLTAGKMVDMSLATFTDIMKVSMGYLNILREAM